MEMLVNDGAPSECFKEVKGHLIELKEWCFSENWAHQWHFAIALVTLAQLAASNRIPCDKELDRTCFASLSPRQWDVFCAFLAKPRIKIPETAYTITVLLEKGGSGCLAVLEVELISKGSGAIYPDPKKNGFLKFEKDFLAAAESVWHLVKQQANATSERHHGFRTIDARFRLIPVRLRTCHDPLSDSLAGRSAEAAFYLSLLQAVQSHWGQPEALLLDQTIAATATISKDGSLGSVTGLQCKLDAAISRELALVIVSDADRVEAEKALMAAKARAPQGNRKLLTEVVAVKSIQQAICLLRNRIREKEVVREHEEQSCSQLSLLGGKAQVPLEDFYLSLPLFLQLPAPDRSPGEIGISRTTAEKKRYWTTTVGDSDIKSWGAAEKGERINYLEVPLEKIFSGFSEILTLAKKKRHPTEPRFVLLGPPGCGKTTLVQYLAWLTAQGKLYFCSPQVIPARIKVHHWQKKKHFNLPQYLAEVCEHIHVGAAPSVEHWQEWLSRGEVFLLLDGLDEIRDDPEFLDLLVASLNAYRHCPVMLTCRTIRFDHFCMRFADYPVFTLGAMAKEMQDQYIRMFPAPKKFDLAPLIKQLDRLPQLKTLTANPLLLSIICFVTANEKQNDLLSTRGGYYDKAVDHLLRIHRKKDIEYPEHISWAQKRFILQKAALELYLGEEQSGQPLISERSMIRALKRGAQFEKFRNTGSIAASLLLDLTENSGLLRNDADNNFLFLHLTLHEFLTASALAFLVNETEERWESRIRMGDRKLTIRNLVECKSWDDKWQEVICFMAGLLDDPKPLLALLMDPKKDDYFRHRLALAVKCLPELTGQTQSAKTDMVDSITDTIIRLLGQAQQKDTEIAFDHLIRVIPFLCQTGGKIRGQIWWEWLVQKLRSKKEKENRVALVFLRNSGSAAVSPILNALSDMLRGDNAYEWHTGAAAIEVMGPAAGSKQVLLALAQLLTNRDKAICQTAMGALRAIGEAAATRPILDLVYEVLTSSDEELRLEAIWTIEAIGPPGLDHPIVEELQLLAESNDWIVQKAVFRALHEMGPSAAEGPVSEAFIKIIETQRYEKLESAIKVIEDAVTTGVADHILTHLAGKIDRISRENCDAAGRAFQAIRSRTAAKTVLSELTQLLESGNVAAQERALRIIAAMGPAAASGQIVVSLASMLLSSDWAVRSYAAMAIEALVPAAVPEHIFSALAELLQSDHENDQQIAVEAIESLKSSVASPTLLDILVHMLENQPGHKQVIAIRAIRAIGPAAATDQVLNALAMMLVSMGRAQRKIAAWAIAGLNPSSATDNIMGGLANMLRSKDKAEWKTAAETIEAMGSSAAKAKILEILLEMLKSSQRDRQDHALRAIRAMGTKAATHPILFALASMLRSKTREDRLKAIATIEAMGPAAANDIVLDTAVRVLRKKDWDEKEAVLRALIAMGYPAVTDKILKILFKMFSSRTKYERCIAASAFKKMMASGVRIFKTANGKIKGFHVDSLKHCASSIPDS